MKCTKGFATITCFAIVIFFLSGENSIARIGETKEKCIKRYGQPQKITEEKFGTTYKFEKKGVIIEVTFMDSLAERISYSTWYRTKKDRMLSDDDISTLLSVNCVSDTHWTKVSDKKEITEGGTTMTTREYDLGNNRAHCEAKDILAEYDFDTVYMLHQSGHTDRPYEIRILEIKTEKYKKANSGLKELGF